MPARRISERSAGSNLVVAPAGATTWAVAVSQHLIPGALFRTRGAAVRYACVLASGAGLARGSIKILGDA